MERVLLISMPFASIQLPSIGISLLKSRLSEEGIPCDIKYFNIVLAEMIGLERYQEIYREICSFQSGRYLIGERLFAQEHFSEQLPDEQRYMAYLKSTYQGPGKYLDELFSIKSFVGPFMDHCAKSISWEHYDIIGFTSMFEQNLASIALAHRIKLMHPDKKIVFGGANCEGEMGWELHRRFTFIDYVCSGEADFSFPELVKRISSEESIEDIVGVIHRENGESTAKPGLTTIENLDVLPYPDYDDYFSQLRQASFPSSTCGELPMETSRGCWWGERTQCTFCGLNGCSLGFRSKSKDRVISELSYLVEKYARKYNVKQVSMVDNILDMKYFKELLPEIKERRFSIELFYETKANLNKKQVQMLREAGITFIQPGIESLNTHVLKLMSKGLSALQNVQLLKYCKQFGVFLDWGILTGFPGEKIEDYEQMEELIYKITHLPPPVAQGPFCLQRFSPSFVSPEKYGIVNIHPQGAYRFVYPFEEASLFSLAYDFEFDYREDVKPPDRDEELSEAVAYWNECYENNDYLYSLEISPSALLIEDGRSNAIIAQVILESAQKDIYEYCDKIRSVSSIFPYIREKYSDHPVSVRDIKDFLDDMVSLNFMVNEDNNYLSLAVPLDEGTSA